MSESPSYGPFRKRLNAFAQALPGVEDGDVEAVHRTRIASRRLRELLPLLEIERRTSQKLKARVRKVTKQLGAVRELDVLILLIDELQPNTRYPSTALKQLSASVGEVRDAARGRLTTKLTKAKLERLARRLERAAKPLETHDTSVRPSGATAATRAWLQVLNARRARRADDFQSAIVAAGGLYVPERLHHVRTALKKLRYVAELSTDVGRRRLTADLATLKRTQDLLGRLHDFEVLLTWGRGAQVALSPPNLLAWADLGTLVHVIEEDCRQLHARYMRDHSALIAVADRLGANASLATAAGRRAAG